MLVYKNRDDLHARALSIFSNPEKVHCACQLRALNLQNHVHYPQSLLFLNTILFRVKI